MATDHERLPDYLVEALRTTDPGGFKSYEAVLNEVIDRQRGLDRPVIRQAIDQYIGRKLIERRSKKSRAYLKDLTASYPPRLTVDMYHCLTEVRSYLNSDEFARVDFGEIRKRLNDSPNVYFWMKFFVDLGFIEHKGSQSGMYRLGSQTLVAVYEESSYENGQLFDFCSLEHKKGPEPMTESPVLNSSSPIVAMAAITDRLENRLKVGARVAGLQSALEMVGVDPQHIEDLLRPLCTEFEPITDPDGKTAEDLKILKESLPVWGKYLNQE